MGFIVSQLIVMALAAVPRDRWRSSSNTTVDAADESTNSERQPA
jgi:hypothetical protein